MEMTTLRSTLYAREARLWATASDMCRLLDKSAVIPDVDLDCSGIVAKRSPSDRDPYPRMGDTDPEETCRNGYPGGL